MNRTMPSCSVISQLVYEDVIAAVEWLTDALGFVERWRVDDHRAQLSFGGCTIAITEPRTSDVRAGPRNTLLRVDDAVASFERACARGASVVKAPRDYFYGERQCTVEDPEGHHWTFSQTIVELAPEDWGGVSGPAASE